MMKALAIVLTLALTVLATPLDDYLNKEDPHYTWRDTGARVKTVFGGVAHVLNVTSQQWLDETKAHNPNGALWTHQVLVVVPFNLEITNISMAYLTGNCNEHVKVPSPTDEDLLVADEVAFTTKAVAIVVFQLPNCPMVYPSDPSQKGRTEDAMIAWAWNEYLKDPTHDPEWLPRLPMAKGAMNCMRAVQEYTTQQKIAAIDGWFVAGASKRGWTTWAVGMATCPKCPNIIGLAPLVPIVPNLVEEVHRQWMAYDGFTFAFKDYLAINLTQHLDDPIFEGAMKVVDPMYYHDRLARLPKVVVLSSDDEFMMMDWSNIWYDQLSGEAHLLIVPDSEHSLATGIPEVITCLGNMINSLARGHSKRPSFDYTFDPDVGMITVTIPPSSPEPSRVVLRHAMTTQKVRRDFRWVRQANNFTGPCKFPDIPLKNPVFGGNCVQPIIWLGKNISETHEGSRVYKAVPPEPFKGFWTGYYVEVYFKSDTGLLSDFQFTTAGYTWPNTLPFEDCHEETCIARIV